MGRPAFSIVIPTRERHATLHYAILSVLFQNLPDFELIVQDNCGGPETWNVVKQFRTPKLKYQRSPRVLPMNENWEAGLSLCEGEYVFFLGDDDALMPDGLQIGAQILGRMPLEVLAWRKYTYWWENAIDPRYHGRLFLHFGNSFQKLEPRALLEGFYDWRVGYDLLPHIYSAFVRRDLIERARAKSNGVYFAYLAPDVWSGLVNASTATDIAFFERGLSLSGNSGASTGCSQFFRSKGAARRKAYLEEEGKTLETFVHPNLIPSENLEINHADHQLRAREMLFPNDDRLHVQIPRVLAAMAANINRDPDSYELVLSEIHQLAAKHSIDITGIAIPPKGQDLPLPQGLVMNGADKVDMLAVNCPEAGVHDVHQAARLATAILPVLTIQ